jgi:Fur family ferric uptake transcriptional regulator
MSQIPPAAATSGEGASDLRKQLQQRGVRITRQRNLLLSLIERSSGHLNVSRLLQMARKKDPTINRATVYRTVALLKEHQLIDELDLMHAEGRSHFYEPTPSKQHFHVVCVKCGRVLEAHSRLWQPLLKEVARQAGFELHQARVEIGGECPACSAGTEARRAA